MERQRDYYGELSNMVKVERVFDEGSFDIGSAYLIKIPYFSATRTEIVNVPGASTFDDINHIRDNIIINYLGEDGVVVICNEFTNSYHSAEFIGVYGYGPHCNFQSCLFTLRIHIDDITKSMDMISANEKPLIEITPMKAKGLTL